MNKKAIVWFRNDLRIHDNESLTEAMDAADLVIPVYIFDERVFLSSTPFGFRKTGVFRAKFILDCISDLRASLKELGLQLLVRVGKPEEILFDLARDVKSSWIFCNRERTQEEIDVQDALEQNLWSIGQEVRYNRGKMLYYTADLPFPVTHTPDIFTHFRKEVEKYVPIREPLPIPASHTLYNLDLDAGQLPTLSSLGYNNREIKMCADSKYIGGEKAGLERLHYYLWKSNRISTYKETRNELLGLDYSTKFSPYLAQGCLSPKRIYHEIKSYEKKREKNDSTYWVFFELLWRDFFRLMGKKHGNKIFQLGGPKGLDKEWSGDPENFKMWMQGNTGIPFIDANMREINSTGFMSNRGRQVVASFLVNDLNVNWLMGAEYFESLLIDYDPCSNYGNWNYVAGVGSDPRENRYFNFVTQAERYDPDAAFIKKWIPEIRDEKIDWIHNPIVNERSESLTSYPPPIVSSIAN